MIDIKKNRYPDNPFVVRRLAAGLYQEDVAAALGVDRSAVAQWETGRAKPTFDNLVALAKLYGCAMEEFIEKEESA